MLKLSRTFSKNVIMYLQIPRIDKFAKAPQTTVYSFDFSQPFSPYRDLKLILPVLNLPTLKFCYSPLYRIFN